MRDRIVIIGSESNWGKEPVPVFETLVNLDVLNPDMVILDEGVTDSLDVCYQYYTERIPVIMVGDDPSQEIWRKTVEDAGADSYLRNPIDHDVLIARVKAILRRYKQRKHYQWKDSGLAS